MVQCLCCCRLNAVAMVAAVVAVPHLEQHQGADGEEEEHIAILVQSPLPTARTARIACTLHSSAHLLLLWCG